MKRKITSVVYLIIGISIVFSFETSCGKKIVEPFQQATYVYKNNWESPVYLELRKNKGIISTFLKKGDSVSFVVGGDIAYPFRGSSVSSSADSVVLRFQGDRCTTYFLDRSSGTFGGEGVFNLKEYDKYSTELISQRNYTLNYSIDSADYKRSVACK